MTQADDERGTKRYSLVLATDQFNEVEHSAKVQHTTMLEIIRRRIRLGEWIEQRQRDEPRSKLILRDPDGSEREIVLF